MKPATIIGILLIVVGVVGFALGGFSFTEREKVLDVGPIEATAEDKETVPIPPILAGLALVGGVVLLVAGARRG
jgi:drug/metabolite transporter (DMT)-like permease